MMNGFEDINPDKYFTKAISTTTRGYKHKLFKKRLSKGLNLRKYFFSQRVVDRWNGLPPNVTDAESINQFKNRFDKYVNKSGYGVLKGLSL
jgi:hypothetical protein